MILSANSFLTKNFLRFCRNRNLRFNIYIFTTDNSIVNPDKRIYDYGRIKELAGSIEGGVVINFAGANIFRTLFSFRSMKKKNFLIWSSRIDFMRRVMEQFGDRASNFVFVLPSAVWVYSNFMRDYFLSWEDTVKNARHLIFRLGIVLSSDCQWVSLIRKFLDFRVELMFPNSFLFPFICIDDFLELLVSNIVNFNESRVIDCFKITTFNHFNSFIKNFYGYGGFFFRVNPFFTGLIVKNLLGDYGKVFDSLDVENGVVGEVEKCFTL
ncbi:MAG: hypothetical protein RMJ36_00075 [Candidatus Calescibacterium sp.]|nr:hypothetical protein [Candidatus Calescibacterium sp.]MDW8132041.1 hypothetical protein [Candidatus Calescibacterium sp.]